jgi:GAF domain-containing protein
MENTGTNVVREAWRGDKVSADQKLLEEHGVKSYCVLPLNSSGRRLGALGFSSLKEDTWSETDLELLQQIANQVGVAVENTLKFESARTAQQQLARERNRSQRRADQGRRCACPWLPSAAPSGQRLIILFLKCSG